MVAQPSRRSTRITVVSEAILGSILLLALIFGAASCHKMPLVAPSGTAITLVASTNVLAVNGTTDVFAVLIEGGEVGTGTGTGTGTTTTAGTGTPVHNGTLVTFTTTLGRIEPAEARTEAGKASAKLIADGRSGTATITAFSGAATTTLDVKVGAAGAARIIVTATPQTLPATGGTASISASVQDQQGNGLLGVPVSFTTDVGSLGATVALSDATGSAATTLTTTTGPATVTASAGGGGTTTLSGTIKISLKTRNSVVLTAPTGAISESVPVTFTITPATGSVVTGVLLDMGDGTKTQLGAITQATSFTYIYGDDGAFTVRATATDADGATVDSTAGVVVSAVNLVGSASPSTAAAGALIAFTATPSVTGISIDHYDWDFGDGTVIHTTSNQQSHAFATPGVQTVTVTLVPTKGHAKPAAIQVKIT